MAAVTLVKRFSQNVVSKPAMGNLMQLMLLTCNPLLHIVHFCKRNDRIFVPGA